MIYDSLIAEYLNVLGILKPISEEEANEIVEIRKMIAAEKKEKQYAAFVAATERQNTIEKGINFELVVMYNPKLNELNCDVDFIPLEGYKNAMLILNEYRSKGHRLNLRTLELTLDDKTVKKINFKY